MGLAGCRNAAHKEGVFIFLLVTAVPALVLSLVLTGYSDVHCHSLLGVFGHILKLLSILTKRIVLYSPKGSHATGHGSTVEARQK